MSQTEVMLVLEGASTVLGLISVALLSGGNGRGWALGAVMIILMGLVYSTRALYGSAALQIFFLVTQYVGWKRWKGRDESDLTLERRKLTWRERVLLLVVCALSTWGGFWVLESLGGQAAAWDSFVTVGSLIAQTLMVWGMGECWLWWLAVDVVYVGLMWQQNLLGYTLLYAVYCVLAVHGWRKWTRDHTP